MVLRKSPFPEFERKGPPKEKKAKRSEADIQKEILEWLNIQPFTFAFRTNNIGVPLKNGGFRKSPTPGLSDLICSHKGRFMAIEVKTPKGKTTEDQEKFLKCCRATKSIGCVVTSVDDIITVLKELDDSIEKDLI